MKRIIAILILIMLAGCGQPPDNNNALPVDTSKQATDNSDVNSQSESGHKGNNPNSGSNMVEEDDDVIKQAFQTEASGIIPAQLMIPQMDLQAPVEKVGQNKQAAMANPKDHKNAGWFKLGPKPGDQGSSVMAGHVNSPANEKSIFWNLDQLQKGDEVNVADQAGEKLTFAVDGKESYDYQNAPIKRIFGYSSSRKLNLITCTGDYNYDAGTHQERLVVYTHLKK